MLAPSRLFERTLRTVRLEVVVRISHISGCIADRYQAATARSAQAAVAPDHLEQRDETHFAACWKYGISSGLLHPLSEGAVEAGAAQCSLNPFPALLAVRQEASSDFTSSPLDNSRDNTRFFCTYHLAG